MLLYQLHLCVGIQTTTQSTNTAIRSVCCCSANINILSPVIYKINNIMQVVQQRCTAVTARCFKPSTSRQSWNRQIKINRVTMAQVYIWRKIKRRVTMGWVVLFVRHFHYYAVLCIEVRYFVHCDAINVTRTQLVWSDRTWTCLLHQ